MRYLLLSALALFATPALAQQVDPDRSQPMVCAYNLTLPTLASGTYGLVQCDVNGRLLGTGGGGGGGGGVATGPVANGTAPAGTNAYPLINGFRDASGFAQTASPTTPFPVTVIGGGSGPSQTATNGTDGQATQALNQQNVTYNYLFNGTTWDRMRGTGGAANVAIASGSIGNTGFNALQAGAATSLTNPLFVQLSQAGTALSSTNGLPTTDTNAAQSFTNPGTGAAKAQAIQGVSGGIAVPTSLASLPAFAATPTFKIDQTTFGSTNGVVPLGIYLATAPTLANTNTNTFQLSPNASLYVDLSRSQGAATYGTAPTGLAPGVNAFITNSPSVNGQAFYDGAGVVPSAAGGAWNATRLDSRAQLKISEAGSADPVVGITPVNTQAGTSIAVKGAAGNLYSITAVALATNAAQEYLACVNSATVPTAAATITPIDLVPIGQGAAAIGYTASINYGAGPPNAYSTGIACVITTSPTTYTAGSNAFIMARAR